MGHLPYCLGSVAGINLTPWKGALDPYELKARLAPALLVILPPALAGIAWFPGFSWTGVLATTVVTCGGTVLLAQVGRDLGKRKEDWLFTKWGGRPSTIRLRHRTLGTNKVTLAKYHTKLSKLLKRKFPTQAQEDDEPAAADELYEAGATFLRVNTRDVKKFPLVFKENCNYGFRRNLWGMKRLGISVSAVGLGLMGARIAYLKDSGDLGLPLACAAVDLGMLLGWIFWFRPDWVRLAADAYAKELVEACEKL